MTPIATRQWLVALLVIGAALVAGLALYVRPAAAANFTVNAVGGSAATGPALFQPNNQIISVGDTVTFRFVSGPGIGHTATAVNGTFNIPLTSTVTSGTWTPTRAGTYYYFCVVHTTPAQATEARVQANDAQVGKIVVLGAAQTAVTTQWETRLIGANEVPPSGSTRSGAFTATLDEAAGTLTWSLAVPSMMNITAAHLHVGAVGVNGPVVLPLFAAPASGPASTISASGTSRVADLTGPLAGNMAGFIAALKGGTIYANAHTTAFPGGEIRGPVVAAGTVLPAAAAAPAPAKTGTGGLVAPSSHTAAIFGATALALFAVGGARLATRRRR